MPWPFPDAALGAAGAIIASMVAAFVALAGLIVSKEQKTSEFRQAWIDALRADSTSAVAQFIVYSEGRQFGGHPTAERSATALAAYRAAEAAVRLRLNVREDASKLAFSRLDQMNHLIAVGDFDGTKVAASTSYFIASVQPILKTEWERVKRGEFWFRAAKVAFLAAVVLAIALLILIYLRAGSTAQPQAKPSQPPASVLHLSLTSVAGGAC